jgi:hypothetical protein
VTSSRGAHAGGGPNSDAIKALTSQVAHDGRITKSSAEQGDLTRVLLYLTVDITPKDTGHDRLQVAFIG